MPLHFATRDASPRKGFTLTELLVAVAIILVLMGLISAAASAARISQKSAQSRSLVSRLDALIRAQIARYSNQSIPELRATINPSTLAQTGTLQIQDRLRTLAGTASTPALAQCRSLLLRARISADLPDRWTDVAYLAETINAAVASADQETDVLALTLAEIRDLLPQLRPRVAAGQQDAIDRRAQTLDALLQNLSDLSASVLEAQQLLRTNSPNLNSYALPAFPNLTFQQVSDALNLVYSEPAIQSADSLAPSRLRDLVTSIRKTTNGQADSLNFEASTLSAAVKTSVFDLLPPQIKTAVARERWLANMTPAQRNYYSLWIDPSTTPTAQFGGAECLFMIVMQSGLFDPGALGTLKGSDIGDKDNDGFPEFLDDWQNPIGFILWAPAIELPVGSGNRVFPTASLAAPFTGAPPPSLNMIPVIYSCGPDLSSGLSKTSASASDETANLSQGQAVAGPSGINSQLLDMRLMLANRIASPQYSLLAFHPNCGNWQTSPTSDYGSKTDETVDYRPDNITNLDTMVRP